MTTVLPLDLCQQLKDWGFPQNPKDGVRDVDGVWHVRPTVPDILSVLEWLEREKGWRWRRDAAGWWAIFDTYGATHRLRSANNPIDLIRQVLAHMAQQESK